MANKFRNLNVDFRDIMKLSLNDRSSMLMSTEGQSILTNFTAEQLASMFPRYYSEKLPSIGKNLSRVSGGKVGTPDTTTVPTTGQPAPSTQQRTAGSRPSATTATVRTTSGRQNQSQQPSWMRNLEGVVPGISDPGAKAQLSREQKEVIEHLKKGSIAADDPRVAFMRDISDDVLRKSGIQRTEQTGKQTYSYVPVTNEQATEEAKKTSSPTITRENKTTSSNWYDRMYKSVYDAATKAGLPNASVIAQLGATQSSLETGYGKRMVGNNAFGIKSHRGEGGTAGVVGASTSEVRGGVSQREQAKFRAYNNPEDSAADYVQFLMKNSRYKGVLSSKTIEEAIQAQGNSGYATDPNYASSLRKINSTYGAGIQTRPSTEPSGEDILKATRNLEYQRESSLAGALLPKLPQGIDPKFAEQYERLSPGQKQKVQEAIQKLGEGNIQSGAQKFNELYRASPELVADAASKPNSGQNLVEMRNQNATRNLPLTTTVNDQLNYAATQAGVRVEVFSGGQKRPFQLPSGKWTSERHTEGRAADVKLYVTDEKGNKRYLDMRNPDDAATMKKFTVAAVHAGATGVGAGPGYMGHSSIHIGGGTTASWGGASWIKQALNEGLARKQQQPFSLEDWKKQQQEKKEQESMVTQAPPEVERKERENTYERVFGVPPQKKTEGTQTPQVTQPAIPAQPSSAPREQAPQQKPQPAQQGTPTALPAAATSPTPPTAAPEKKRQDEEESTDKQAFALGGETEAQGPLTAYAIDKDKMRRDDTIVTDGRVRFTMNSEKESMKYNPDTGKVQIDQARGEARQKINASELGPETKAEATMPEPQPQPQPAAQMIPQPVQPTPQQNSFDATTSLVDDIFKSASFKRAVASSRFMKDSDPLGGHYDQGAYNIV